MVTVVVAAALLLPMAGVQAQTRPQTLYAQAPVTSGPVEPGFPIDHVGVVFELPGEAHDHGSGDGHGVAGLAVRLRTDGTWGPWQPVPEGGAQAPGQWTGALVPAGDAEAYQVRGLPAGAEKARAAAINTTDGPQRVVGHRSAGSAEAVASCQSRADWGADESLRSDDRAHAPVQVLTVHHTATENDDPDPAATVRAIYRYHTQTNEWDDIGYQTLVGPDGTVFEGRWSGSDSPSCQTAGGTTRPFGHLGDTDDAEMVTGAHVGGYNTGNFGVALLGTFTDTAPTPAARDTTVSYLAELADRHGLDPQGTIAYDNGVNATTADAISGHRDFVATECPGDVFHAGLPQLRDDVAAAMADGGTGDGGGGAEDGTTSSSVTSGENSVRGTVAGSHVDTHSAGGDAEAITETESSGKPSRRTSGFHHVWTLPGVGTDTGTLSLTASTTASDDGDDVDVAVSADGGATWTSVLTLPAGRADTWTATVPAADTLQVRVLDTDRTGGNRSLDTVTVDHLALTAEGTSGDGTTDDGTTSEDASIGLSATSRKHRGDHYVDLSWTGATEVVVRRGDGASWHVSGSQMTDQVDRGTHTYTVCATDDPSNCSEPVTVRT